MADRVPATDSSVSWPQHGYSYRTVLPAGREYVQLLRRRSTVPGRGAGASCSSTSNELAGDAGLRGARALGGLARTRRCSRTRVDLDGDEVYELRFRDLASGGTWPTSCPAPHPAAPGRADSAYFFYIVHDDLWRQHQVWRHRLGTPSSDDVLVLEEPDEQFELDVQTTRTGDLVVIWSENRDTSEVWVVDAARPDLARRARSADAGAGSSTTPST